MYVCSLLWVSEIYCKLMETSLVTNDILYVCQKSLQYNNVYTRRSTEVQQTLQEHFYVENAVFIFKS